MTHAYDCCCCVLVPVLLDMCTEAHLDSDTLPTFWQNCLFKIFSSHSYLLVVAFKATYKMKPVAMCLELECCEYVYMQIKCILFNLQFLGF